MKILSSTIRIFLLLLTVGSGSLSLEAQVPIPSEVQAELARRNIDEAELRSRLLARGIDIDTVDPSDLPLLQAEIEAVLIEMEAEQAAVPTPGTAVITSDSIPPAEVEEIPLGEIVPSAPAVSAVLEPENPIYGHSIFRDGSLEVQSGGGRLRPPPNYRLGVGDVLVVSIFGRSQADLQFTIDPDGYIRPPRMPRVFLLGLPQVEAEEILRRRFGQYYVFGPGEFAVTVSAARTITVNVFGEVAVSGSYSLSALNTAFNALVAAGGPTEAGTVRQVRLIRGETVQLIDVYDFLTDPSQVADFSLEDKDVIFVAPVRSLVTIAGAVRRPQRYEFLPNESLSDLIAFAGGLAGNALDGRVRVRRVENGEEQVLSVAAEDANSFPLRNGDEVEVLSVINPVERFVAVEGEVDLPGRYEYREGLRLSYLIDQGRLRPGSRRDLAFLLRINPDGTRRLLQVSPTAAMANPGSEADVLLMNADRLLVFASSSYVDESFISVSGSVRSALDSFPYPSDQAMTLAEAILLAGGLQTNADPRGFIIRTDLRNRTRQEYLEIDLEMALNSPSSSANIVLQPYDQVIVYEQERFVDVFEVSISGAVREEGIYPYDASLGIGELIRLAGGFRLDAATNRVEVFRLQYNRNQATQTVVTTLEFDEDLQLITPVGFRLQPFDQVIVRSVSEFEAIKMVEIIGEVAYPGEYAILNDNERISDLLNRAGGLTEEAFPAGGRLFREVDSLGAVVLNLDQVLVNSAEPSNMVLREGDRIEVPKRQDLVTIMVRGTRAENIVSPVLIENGRLIVAFQGARPIDWYIDRFAGGYDRQVARRRWTTIRYANGQVQRISKTPLVQPGSTIMVGIKPPKRERDSDRERTSVSEIVQATLGGVTTLVTLYVLITRI
ncbi:MAG: SLBB domain-containing protein [Bacteroidota bacterium]